MTTSVRTLLTPFPLQAEIIAHPARYKIVATGRRSGKTTLGIYRQVRLAEYPDMLLWWVAPTNSAAFLAWERFKLALAGKPHVKVSETRKRLVLPNGSQLWCKSAEEPVLERNDGSFAHMREERNIKKLITMIEEEKVCAVAEVEKLELYWHPGKFTTG